MAVGIVDLKDLKNDSLKFYEAEKLIQHELYRFELPDTIYNNVGLIRVKGKIAFDDNIQPIGLPEYEDPSALHMVATSYGWGQHVCIVTFRGQ